MGRNDAQQPASGSGVLTWFSRAVRAGSLALVAVGAPMWWPTPLPAQPDEPPAGFVWEDLKEIHTRILRPEKWFFRQVVMGEGWTFQFSPTPFEGEGEIGKGLMIQVIPKVKATLGKSADEFAAATLAELATKGKVFKGWTKTGEPPGPFTTYVLCCSTDEGPAGVPAMLEIVGVANRDTDTLYGFVITSPRGQWQDVAKSSRAIVASLRLDPKF